jgi:hypothetical protein
MIPLAGPECQSHILLAMRVRLTEDSVEVRLALWEKVLGLLGDIVVPRADVSDARVVSDPLREAMSAGIKAGLRLPWLCYVCRTIRLDQAFVVRRGLPALSFTVRNHGALRRVLVSTADAEALARRLRSP